MIDRCSTGKRWMKRAFLVIAALLVTALLAGCFQTERTITLKPDGSGTVEEVVLLGKALTSMFENEEAPDDAGNAKKANPKKKKDKLAEQKKEARAKVAKMGEGVSLVSVTPVTRGEFEGYRAVYRFRDINKLRLSSDSPADQSASQDAGKMTTYRFTKGEKNVLVVVNAPPNTKTEPPAVEETKSAAESEQQADKEAGMAMLKQMFDGMRISEKIVVEGTVVETNALFQSGSEITVVDVDFGKMLSTNPQELEKLQSVPQGDKQQLLLAMSKIPGFKVDLNEELRVVFRKKGK